MKRFDAKKDRARRRREGLEPIGPLFSLPDHWKDKFIVAAAEVCADAPDDASFDESLTTLLFLMLTSVFPKASITLNHGLCRFRGSMAGPDVPRLPFKTSETGHTWIIAWPGEEHDDDGSIFHDPTALFIDPCSRRFEKLAREGGLGWDFGNLPYVWETSQYVCDVLGFDYVCDPPTTRETQKRLLGSRWPGKEEVRRALGLLGMIPADEIGPNFGQYVTRGQS